MTRVLALKVLGERYFLSKVPFMGVGECKILIKNVELPLRTPLCKKSGIRRWQNISKVPFTDQTVENE